VTLPPLPRPRMWKYYTLLVVVHTIGRMPLRWRYGIARFLSDRVYRYRQNIRENIRSNVHHVLGPQADAREVERIARQCARNTGRYYADVIGMHRMDVQKFYKHDLRLDGLAYVLEAQRSGHGVVLASAHYANPEFAVQGLAAAGVNVFALVEPLDPPQLGALMRSLRTVHGHHYEPVSFGAVKRAVAWLRQRGVVAILIDRDIQKRGIVLDFCGYPARFPTGAVDLAMRTDAVLIPGWVRRIGEFKVHAIIGPPMPLVRTGDTDADVRTNTANLLSLFEEHLRKDPGQWSVLDRIWPADLPATPASPRRKDEAPDEQAVQ